MNNKARPQWKFLCLAAMNLAMIECSQDGTMLRIHYVPIGIETFTPVTSENIEQRGAVCIISKPSNVAEIKRIIVSATPATRDEDMFTNMAVRVKIEETDRKVGEHWVAIVDNHGPVRIGVGNQRLSEHALGDLKMLIDERLRLFFIAHLLLSCDSRPLCTPGLKAACEMAAKFTRAQIQS